MNGECVAVCLENAVVVTLLPTCCQTCQIMLRVAIYIHVHVTVLISLVVTS